VSPNRFDLNAWQTMEEEVRIEDERQRAAGLPPAKRYKSLHPNSAVFLFQLVIATAARRIVEVGTSAGYSTLWLGRAARFTGGRVVTLERDPAVIAVARDHFARATVAGFVEIRPGDALELLEDMEEGIDLAFIDAEKEEYLAYARALWPKLAPGASLVADNVISHAEATAPYLEYLCGLEDADTTVLPVGNGLGWTVKEPPAPGRNGPGRENHAK